MRTNRVDTRDIHLRSLHLGPLYFSVSTGPFRFNSVATIHTGRITLHIKLS